MSAFQSILLREKFVITAKRKTAGDASPVAAVSQKKDSITAVSNRLTLTLGNKSGKGPEKGKKKAKGKKEPSGIRESYVIRTQTMHSCVRLAAHIAQEFEKRGPLLPRPGGYNWGEVMDKLFKYELRWNKGFWAAIYVDGKPIATLAPENIHPFFDIIEAYDIRNKDNYDASLNMAEIAFKTAGKDVDIAHDGNIAMIATIRKTADGKDEGKCGLILRRAGRTSTFNITLEQPEKKPDRDEEEHVTPARVLSAGATLLEGIQLAFVIGQLRYKTGAEKLSGSSPEAKQNMDAAKRLARSNGALNMLEQTLHISYRPERPDFSSMIDEAEEFARKADPKNKEEIVEE